VVFGSLHGRGPRLAGQHGEPGVPQPLHPPSVHIPKFMPPSMQAMPVGVQLPATQQPPVRHMLPAQQAWPGPPQGTQVPESPPAAEHAEPSVHGVAPAQHGLPAEPHVAHTLAPGRHRRVAP
jgi:hypothetical protein